MSQRLIFHLIWCQSDFTLDRTFHDTFGGSSFDQNQDIVGVIGGSCVQISMFSRRYLPRWSRWVNLDLRKLWVDPPTIPIQSNVLRKNWSTDCVEIGFSPLLNFVFFESVKNTWSSVVSSCCLIHDWRPSMTLGWIGIILDSFVLVDDFSIVRVPSTKFRFRTLMVVISLTRPAEKYISSARSEYLIGRLEQNDSIWFSVRQADLTDRFVLHIGHQREGRWTWDRVLLDDQPHSTTMILDLLSKRPSIKSSYDSFSFVGVCRCRSDDQDQLKYEQR